MEIYYLYNFERFFKFIKKFSNTIFLNREIFNVQLNFIILFIFIFKLMIIINKFDISNLNENYLFFKNFIDFAHFNDENFHRRSI